MLLVLVGFALGVLVGILVGIVFTRHALALALDVYRAAARGRPSILIVEEHGDAKKPAPRLPEEDDGAGFDE